MKSRFFTCPYYRSYRIEVTDGLSLSDYTFRITIFVSMLNLGQFLKNGYFINNHDMTFFSKVCIDFPRQIFLLSEWKEWQKTLDKLTGIKQSHYEKTPWLLVQAPSLYIPTITVTSVYFKGCGMGPWLVLVSPCSVVLINNATYQRETLPERPIRQPLSNLDIEQWSLCNRLITAFHPMAVNHLYYFWMPILFCCHQPIARRPLLYTQIAMSSKFFCIFTRHWMICHQFTLQNALPSIYHLVKASTHLLILLVSLSQGVPEELVTDLSVSMDFLSGFNLPISIRSSSTVCNFKHGLKTHMF